MNPRPAHTPSTATGSDAVGMRMGPGAAGEGSVPVLWCGKNLACFGIERIWRSKSQLFQKQV